MLKYFIILFVIILGALAWMYYLGSINNVYRQDAMPIFSAHRFNDPSHSIEHIEIKALYVVPKDHQDKIISDWQPVIRKHLQELGAFHELQLRGRSSMTFDIYPEIVIARQDHRVYEADMGFYSNPVTLSTITREIEKRVLSSAGDLYQADFALSATGSYRSLYIIYEGAGASANDHVALLSRSFLTDSNYMHKSQTYFAHEFYHTLGLPDAHDLASSLLLTDDIMGFGRERPLDQAYIAHESIKGFGL